jgi:hypothetical protein
MTHIHGYMQKHANRPTYINTYTCRADVDEMYDTVAGSRTGTSKGTLYLPEISAASVLLSPEGRVNMTLLADLEKKSGAKLKVHAEPSFGRLIEGKGLSKIEEVDANQALDANISTSLEVFRYRGRDYHEAVWGGLLHARGSDLMSHDAQEVCPCLCVCLYACPHCSCELEFAISP